MKHHYCPMCGFDMEERFNANGIYVYCKMCKYYEKAHELNTKPEGVVA